MMRGGQRAEGGNEDNKQRYDSYDTAAKRPAMARHKLFGQRNRQQTACNRQHSKNLLAYKHCQGQYSTGLVQQHSRCRHLIAQGQFMLHVSMDCRAVRTVAHEAG